MTEEDEEEGEEEELDEEEEEEEGCEESCAAIELLNRLYFAMTAWALVLSNPAYDVVGLRLG